MAAVTWGCDVDTGADRDGFGEVLRASRRAASISQQQLADRAGLSVAAIRDLEQGRTRRPRRGVVEAMVAVLELTGDTAAAFRAAAGDRSARPSAPVGPLRIQVLGPLTVTRGLSPVPVGRGRRRALLARLALAPNTTVPTADLIDLLWGASPPPAPARTVQIYVSRLRAAFQPDDAGQVTRTSGGYRLDLSDDQLDLADFRRLVRRARTAEPVQALAMLETALGLWCGGLLTDIPELRLHPLSIAVMDEYIGATLWFTDLALATGGAARALPRLRELAAANPLHEPLHARLMAVLAASSLQAAALDVYADIRRRLVDDLGIEPGPALVEAHRRVLRQEPSTVDVTASPDDGRPDPPAQLPAGTPSFTGRLDALAWLGLPAAASLAGVPPAIGRDLLAELTRASLLVEADPGRFALHDLLRAYATELACECETPGWRRDALARLLDHYLHTAVEADRQLSPLRPPAVIPLGGPAPGAVVSQLSEPLPWFTVERANLLAVLCHASDAGLARQVWQLAWATDTALERQGHWSDFADAWRLALAGAGTLSDVRARAFAHRRLAHACTLLGRDADADANLGQALRLYENAADHVGQAIVHHSLSHLYEQRHDLEQALHHAERALACARSAGDEREQAAALNAIGWCHAQLGRHAEALTHSRQALRLFAAGDHRALADTWDTVGFACHHLGDHGGAAHAYRQARALARQAGARHLEATVLTHLGDTHHAAGEDAAARAAWEAAVDILRTIDASAADQVRDRLRTLP